MRAFINPLLLVACILLLVVGAASPAWTVTPWVLLVCIVAFVSNGTLGMARALTGRPSVQPLGWAVGFLMFGCVVWSLVSDGGMESVSSQERALLEQRLKAWKSGQVSPWHVDENGDCVLTLAAGLGRVDVIRDPDLSINDPISGVGYVAAAHRAAERNREEVLRALIPQRVAVDTRMGGMTPLHAATMHRASRAVTCLLELGADVHAVDAEGMTPLHCAVLAEDAALVRVLLQHGADPSRLDNEGRDAASYARSEEVESALRVLPASP